MQVICNKSRRSEKPTPLLLPKDLRGSTFNNFNHARWAFNSGMVLSSQLLHCLGKRRTPMSTLLAHVERSDARRLALQTFMSFSLHTNSDTNSYLHRSGRSYRMKGSPHPAGALTAYNKLHVSPLTKQLLRTSVKVPIWRA